MLAAGALYATRTRTLFPLAAGLAERYVERRFGAEVAVEGLAGDGFRTLRARALHLAAREGSPTRLRELYASEIEVDLSLLDLLRGRPDWLSSVRARSLDAEVDLTRPGSGRGGDSDGGEGGPSAIPEFHVERLSGAVRVAPSRSIGVRGGSVRSTPTADGPALELSGLAVELGLIEGAEAYAGTLTASLVLGDELYVERASFTGAEGRAGARDLFLPYESLRVDSLLEGAGGELELEVQGLLARLGAKRQEEPSRLVARGHVADGVLSIDTATLQAAGGVLRVDRGTLRLEEGSAVWTLSLSADVPRLEDLRGLLGTRGWTGALAGSARVEGRGSQAFLLVEARSERLELAGSRFGTGSLSGSLRMDVRAPWETTGELALRASPAWIAGREVEQLEADLTLAADALYVRKLAARQPGNRLGVEELVLPRTRDPARLLAGARGDVELEITDAARLLEDAPARALPEHRLVLSADVRDAVATLRTAELSIAGGAFRSERGTLSLASARSEVLLDVAASFDFPDLAPLGALIGEPSLAGRLVGELEAAGPILEPAARFEARGEALGARGFDVDQVQLAGEVVGRSVRVDRLSASSHDAVIELAGALDARGDGVSGDLQSLRLARGPHELVLRAPFAYTARGRRLEIEPFVLEGTAGALEVRASGEESRWSAEILAQRLDLDEVLPGRGLGGADGSVRLERDGDLLRLVLAISIDGWRVPGVEGLVDADLDLVQENQHLVVSRLDVISDAGLRFAAVGEAPLDWTRWPDPFAEGPMRFRANVAEIPLDRFALPPRWEAIAREGKGALDAELTGTWREPEGRVELTFTGLSWTGDPPPAAETPEELARERAAAPPRTADGDLTCALALEPGAVAARIAASDPGRATAEGTARLDADVDLSRVLRGDLAAFADAPLEASLESRSSDLSWLSARVPGVRRAAGSMLADLGLEGTPSEPFWTGSLVLTGGEVKLESDLPSLSDLRGTLHLEGRSFRVAGLSAELGGAPIRVSGRVDVPPDGPAELDLTFRGESLLLHRDPEVLLRADAELALSGPWTAPKLSGTLRMQRSWISKRMPLLERLLDLQPGRKRAAPGSRGIPLFSFRDPPLSNLSLDLSVESEEPIRLRSNVARGGLSPSLRVTGTGLVPRLEGTVYLEPTTVSLPGASVLFNTGTFTFEARDPFVPQLSLVGKAEKFGHDITAVVTGPYDEPEIELSATPPLSAEDIVLILFAGRPPTGFATDGSVEATQTIAVYVARDFANAWLSNGGDDDESIFDKVEVVTGRDISRNGVPTIEIRFRVDEDFVVDGDRVYLAFERDVYEDNNLGVRFAFRLR